MTALPSSIVLGRDGRALLLAWVETQLACDQTVVDGRRELERAS